MKNNKYFHNELPKASELYIPEKRGKSFYKEPPRMSENTIKSIKSKPLHYGIVFEGSPMDFPSLGEFGGLNPHNPFKVKYGKEEPPKVSEFFPPINSKLEEKGEKKKSNKMLKYGIVSALAGASLFSGCATMTGNRLPDEYKEPEKREYAPMSEAMEVLGEKSPMTIEDYNGYKFSAFDKANLQVAAGIYAGTVEAIKTDKGYLFRGTYSEFAHPEAMDRVMKDADVDGDMIISRKEARDITSKFLK